MANRFHGFRFCVMIGCWIVLSSVTGSAEPLDADGTADPAVRFAVFFPLSSEPRNDSNRQGSSQLQHRIASGSLHAISGSSIPAWTEYCRTWRMHVRSPADSEVLQRLGWIVNHDDERPTLGIPVAPGRDLGPLRSLRLPTGQMKRWDTPHFAIFTDLDDQRAIDRAIDLERFYAVWTQMFFLLWSERERWDRLAQPGAPRRSTKMRVVLFADSESYARALSSEVAGIERSTGYYSHVRRTSFFHDSLPEDTASRYHELTHQLFSEATLSRLRTPPGERRDFWLVEGIACYMESTHFKDDWATVGGWESSQLQFARHRALAEGEMIAIESLRPLGRLAFQRRGDLARAYTFAACHTHHLIDARGGDGLNDVIAELARIYQVTLPAGFPSDGIALDQDRTGGGSLIDYLRLTDETVTPIDRDDLNNLFLGRSRLSIEALDGITPQRSIRWLDLSMLSATTTAVSRLYPEPRSLEQLSLERTAIDPSIGNWLALAPRLRELDLSFTRVDDTTLGHVDPAVPIETMWLTGTRISDRSIELLSAIRTLKSLDLQRTDVTEEGRQRLRRLRPDIRLDPLELVQP